MKKTFHVDAKLLREARSACGAATDTETLRLGLEALVRHTAYQRLRALIGTEPDAEDVPRRSENAHRRQSVVRAAANEAHRRQSVVRESKNQAHRRQAKRRRKAA